MEISALWGKVPPYYLIVIVRDDSITPITSKKRQTDALKILAEHFPKQPFSFYFPCEIKSLQELVRVYGGFFHVEPHRVLEKALEAYVEKAIEINREKPVSFYNMETYFVTESGYLFDPDKLVCTCPAYQFANNLLWKREALKNVVIPCKHLLAIVDGSVFLGKARKEFRRWQETRSLL